MDVRSLSRITQPSSAHGLSSKQFLCRDGGATLRADERSILPQLL